MRIFALGVTLGLSASSFAGTMWDNSSIEGNFNSASSASSLLKDQTGWTSYAGQGPTIANGKAELYGAAGEGAKHAIAPTGSFLMGQSEIDVGFTLVIHSLTAGMANTSTQLLQIETSVAGVAIRATQSADGKGVNLSLSYQTLSGDSPLLIPLDTPTRLVLTMQYTKSYNYNVTLSALDATGAAVSSITMRGVAGNPPTGLIVFTTPLFQGGLDDLRIGNSKADVFTVAHAPEPATAMLSLPVLAGLLMRRKS